MTGNTQQPPTGNPFAALKAKIDPALIKQREGWRDRNGNTHYVDYIEWHAIADILDEHKPDWSSAIKNIQEIGEVFIVTVAVTIDGVTREGIGTGAAGSELGIKKAEHDALKRAAVKFGVGRELYKKESDEIERKGSTPVDYATAAPMNPLPRSHSDMITAKQIGMIRGLAGEKGVNEDDECGKIYGGLKMNEISKRAASWLIEHLKEMPDAGALPREVRTGIPDTTPPVNFSIPDTTPASNQKVREMPNRQTAPSTPARENTAAQMRQDICAAFDEVGQNADNSLAAYDVEQDLAKKRDICNGILKYVGQIKREQVKQWLAGSGWDQNGIDGELGKFGIEDGLHRATAEQVDAIWADFKKHKLL